MLFASTLMYTHSSLHSTASVISAHFWHCLNFHSRPVIMTIGHGIGRDKRLKGGETSFAQKGSKEVSTDALQQILSVPQWTIEI